MPKPIDRTGHKIGRWTVLQEVSRSKNQKQWLCRCDCGTEKVLSSSTLSGARSKSCGCLKLEMLKSEEGFKNRAWKGGRHINDQGYVGITNRHHPRAKSNGIVLEHILVMEQKLGRTLNKNETVHHINGVRSDNRPENLELWVKSQPKGQRVIDLISWAEEIIHTYESVSLGNK